MTERYLGMEMGTPVRNPVHRSGRPGFIKCCHCGKHYTSLGIGRHWSKCPKNPKNLPTAMEEKRSG